MRVIDCSNPHKGSKYNEPLPQPGWLDRVKNYPDIDKKRLGPCTRPGTDRKKSV